MNKDIIDGNGSKLLPMFSFGTSFIKLDNNNDNIIYDGIAAGHTKIILSKLYENENIKSFIKNKNEELSTLDNYIEHNSYIYMCYFIRLIKYKNNTYKLYISDSYLFIDKEKKYIFSICFPMGLVSMDDNILVSYGYGDYYNCIIEFNKKNLIDNIKHDVQNFDYTKYHFKILSHNTKSV